MSIKSNLRIRLDRIVKRLIYRTVMNIILFDIRIFVDSERVFISDTATMSNAFLNTNSGTIKVGDYTFCGQNVSLITGAHNYEYLGDERKSAITESGNDIVIGSGVWIGSHAIILGPCMIGDNSVISAGSLVINDIEANTVVGGVPAKIIKRLNK